MHTKEGKKCKNLTERMTASHQNWRIGGSVEEWPQLLFMNTLGNKDSSLKLWLNLKGHRFNSQQENFLLQVNFLCWLLCYHSSMQIKRSQSLCQKQEVTAKHKSNAAFINYSMYVALKWSDTVNWYMVYTECAPRWQHSQHQPWRTKTALKLWVHHLVLGECSKTCCATLVTD